MNPTPDKSKRRMLCLTMPPDLVRFLDDLAWDLMKKSGCNHRLDRMTLLRALVQVFRDGRFDVAGIRTEDEFIKTLLSQISGRHRVVRSGKPRAHARKSPLPSSAARSRQGRTKTRGKDRS